MGNKLFSIKVDNYMINLLKNKLNELEAIQNSNERNNSVEYNKAHLIFMKHLVEELHKKSGTKLIYEEKSSSKLEIDKSVHEILNKILDNPDYIDEIYERIVPKKYRKLHGQFFTPSIVADFMVECGLRAKCKSVLDPSVGTGIFISKILKKSNEIENISCIDIDKIMLNITNFRIQHNEKVNLINTDFLEFEENKKFDFIICNPPYMKFHYFDRNKNVDFIEKKYNLKISKLVNIYSLFFIHSSSFLKENGTMVFITPGEFLYTGYGKMLKTFLLNNFTIEAFVLVNLDKTIFNDALTSAVITILKKTHPVETHKVKFIEVSEWNNNKEIFDALNSKESQNISFNCILQKSLNPDKKWLIHFGKKKAINIQNLIKLKEIDEVKRGIATGHNEFFTLTDSEVKKFGIDNTFLKPVISKAMQCKNYDFSKDDFEKLKITNGKMFLLYCFSQPSENLRKYIEYGKSLNVNKRYLASKRNPWFSMEKRDPAPILATVFSRDNMRFIYNDAGVLNLASFHGIYPKFKDKVKIKALLAYLNSNEAKNIMFLEKRIYGGGLDKFEPKDLEEIMVIDINNLDKKIIKKLSKFFDALCIASRNNNIKGENQIKTKIDKIIKNIIDSKNITSFIN